MQTQRIKKHSWLLAMVEKKNYSEITEGLAACRNMHIGLGSYIP